MAPLTDTLAPDRARAFEAALAGVIDPCSRFNGTHLSFVDLGMVEGLSEPEPGRVVVRLLLDDPFCLYMVDIRSSVRDALLDVPGVHHVDIEVIADRVWDPDMMTAETQAKYARWREIRRRRAAQDPPPLLTIAPLAAPGR
jgi:metal-sulfur cluster biosynthetic enzyme